MNFFKKLFGQADEEEAKALKDAEIINRYNAQFKHSLEGKWISAEGTFAMQSDVFEFFENGRGRWLSCGGSYEDTVHFDWREKAPFTIEIREDAREDGIEEDQEDSTEDQEDWIEVEYGFKIIQNDVAEEVILCQKNSDTFYGSMTRISYSERV